MRAGDKVRYKNKPYTILWAEGKEASLCGKEENTILQKDCELLELASDGEYLKALEDALKIAWSKRCREVCSKQLAEYLKRRKC